MQRLTQIDLHDMASLRATAAAYRRFITLTADVWFTVLHKDDNINLSIYREQF